MATTQNGISPELPRSDSPSSLGKRKRASSEERDANTDFIKTEDTAVEQSGLSLGQHLRDVLEILKGSELSYSLLTHPIAPKSSEEPNNKRPRLTQEATDDSVSETIKSRIESGSYSKIEDILSDLDIVSASIDLEQQTRDRPLNGHTAYNETPLTSRILACKKHLSDLLRRDTTIPAAQNLNGEEEEILKIKPAPHNTRTVLTFYGHAPNTPQPRQVFSSLQLPQRIDVGSSIDKSTVEVFAPIREMALPNGITPSNVLPFHPPKSSKSKTKEPTFGEVFAPDPKLPGLPPPPQSRHRATRSQSVHWYNPDGLPATSSTIATGQGGSRTNYKDSKMRTGSWLRHSSGPSRYSLSPEFTRKSTDDAEVEREKSMALFRRAYGGIAPSRDNSNSTVPQDIADLVWWQRVGERQFSQVFFEQDLEDDDIDEELDVIDSIDPSLSENNDLEIFEKAVQEWQPNDDQSDFDEMTSEKIDASVEGILDEISDLLETLSSYQRIRYLSVNPNTRAGAGSSSQFLSNLTGGVATPSSGEFDTYEMLRESLSSMIALLPPYAVARLDGDRLKDLNISTKITLENTNYKGTMEEDDTTLQSRNRLNSATSTTARPTAPGYAANPRVAPYQQSSTPAQFSQRANYLNQPALSRPTPNYQTPLTYAGRPNSAQYSGNVAPNFQNRQAQSTTPRPPYPPNHFAQAAGSQPNQHPLNQQFPSPRQDRVAHGDDSPSSGIIGWGSTTIDGRSPSPAYSPGQSQQRNTSAISSNSTNPPRYFQQQHHPSQYAQYPQTKSPPVNTSGLPNLGSYMTAAHSAIMMDRTQIPRQSSGTPQPANGQHSPPNPSSTPVGRQINGTTAVTGQ